MAAKDNKNTKKVSGALVAAVVVIIAIAAFVPTVYMPYKNKKPEMDAKHQEAMDTIDFYNKSIENQSAIEAEIDELTAKWDEYQKSMFIDPATALKDVNDAINKQEITLKEFKQLDPKEDPSGTVTAEGNPLYYQTINIQGRCTQEQLIKLLSYIEEESIGAYYVKKLEASPPNKTAQDSDIADDVLDFKMDVYLYYFNQSIVIKPETSDTDSGS